MKNSNKAIEDRRSKLIECVKKQKLSISELSQKLNASEMTIRRDCSALEKMGIVSVKLGMVKLQGESDEINSSIDFINDKIAAEATKLITDNDVIFINSSKTAIKAIKHITNKNITLITNNLVSLSYEFSPEVNLVLSGGKFERPLMAMVDDISYSTFKNIHANIAIIGCDGIDLDNGISTSKINGARINRIIIQNSKKVILVANYKKIGNISNFKIADITNFDTLITDSFADKKILNSIENKGVRVVQVEI